MLVATVTRFLILDGPGSSECERKRNENTTAGHERAWVRVSHHAHGRRATSAR